MKNKEKKEQQTAIEYLRSIDDTINIMESIQNETAQEQEALIESRSNVDYTDADGVFDMGNLMDVDIPQNAEENTPQLYNAPVEELDESDKALITDEFVNTVKNWQDTVIDFSDIGPVATVIQNKLGYRQDIEGFLNELINTAVEKQDSQSFANGSQPVPGMKGKPVTGDSKGGPADIAPKKAGLGDDAPMDDAPVNTMDIDPAAELAPPVDAGFDNELDPSLGADIAPEGEGDLDLAPEGDIAPEGDLDLAPEGDIAPESDEEIAPEADDIDETDETDSEDGEKKDEKDIDFQLEAIREQYKGKKIDAQLESIKANLLGTKVESIVKKDNTAAVLESISKEYHKKEDAKVEAVTKEKKLGATLESIAANYHKGSTAKVKAVTKEKKLEATLESIAANYHNGSTAKVEAVTKEKKLESTLESIASNYHNGEKAKVEAVTKEKKLEATLESIASNYRNKEKAKVESITKEQKLNATLESLVESYHKDAKKAKVGNASVRDEAKAKIQNIDKK